MSNSHRSRRSNSGHRSRRRQGRGHYTGEPNGLQPGDDVGNRRSMKQAALPPDDLGNRKEPIESSALLPDDTGNRIDLPPTHEVSGVLAELDGRRRRKKKGTGPLMRIGRYFVGGVNPLVSGMQPPVKPVTMPTEMTPNGETGADVDADAMDDDEMGRRKRRRRRRRDGRDQIDGAAAQEVSQRRAQRFFDFEEDDRFEYVLKSDAQSKCDAAREAVHSVLMYAQREAIVEARVIEDRDRPKVVVTIDEKGPAASLAAEQRSESADQPLFVLGNAALMALNYLVNKVVNRYPDDRIRLAILPKADEPLYLESLAQHLKAQEEKGQSDTAEEKTAGSDPQSVNGALNGQALVNGVSESQTTIEVVGDEKPAETPAEAVSKVSAEAPASEEVEVSETPAEAEAPQKKTRARSTKSTGTAKKSTAKSRTASARKPKAEAEISDAEANNEEPVQEAGDDEESAAPVKKTAKKTAKKTTKKVAKKTTKKVAKKSSAGSAKATDDTDAEVKPKKTTKKSAAGASKKVSTSRKTKASKTSAKDEAEDT